MCRWALILFYMHYLAVVAENSVQQHQTDTNPNEEQGKSRASDNIHTHTHTDHSQNTPSSGAHTDTHTHTPSGDADAPSGHYDAVVGGVVQGGDDGTDKKGPQVR
jgi:cytoskeletal protein RodZ